MSKIPEVKSIAILYEDTRNVYQFGFRKDIERMNEMARNISYMQRGHFEVMLVTDTDRLFLSVDQFILISDLLIYIDRNFEKEKAKEKKLCQKKSLTQEKSKLQR